MNFFQEFYNIVQTQSKLFSILGLFIILYLILSRVWHTDFKAKGLELRQYHLWYNFNKNKWFNIQDGPLSIILSC